LAAPPGRDPLRSPLGCRVYWARPVAVRDACVPKGAGGRFFRRLRGDLAAGHAPGLAPSPGRSWLHSAAGVPIKAVPMRPLAVTVTHPGPNLFPPRHRPHLPLRECGV